MHRFQLHWSLALEIIPGPSPCAVLSPASRTWTSCCLVKWKQGWRKCLHAQVKRLTTPSDSLRQHGDFGGRRLVKGFSWLKVLPQNWSTPSFEAPWSKSIAHSSTSIFTLNKRLGLQIAKLTAAAFCHRLIDIIRGNFPLVSVSFGKRNGNKSLQNPSESQTWLQEAKSAEKHVEIEPYFFYQLHVAKRLQFQFAILQCPPIMQETRCAGNSIS